MTCKRVLLVDDEYLIRYVLASTLQGQGVEVVAVASAEEALRQLEGLGFDLCFLDVKLPGMSGTDALPLIRRRSPGTRVVLMSGHANPEGCGHPAGAAGFLEKPFSLERVREFATRFLDEDDDTRGLA